MSEYGRVGLGKRAYELDVSPKFDGYTGVEIATGTQDDEGNDLVFFAGDDTGRVFRIVNPWGTQEQAENILASFISSGFQYQPFRVSKALLTPAAEIGDAVSVNGIYSGIYKVSKNFGSLMGTDITAPQDEEIDHEYPYESPEERNATRQMTAIESKLSIHSDEIDAKVSQIGGDNSSFGWSLLADHFSLFSGSNEVFRVDSEGATVKGVITATSGQIGGFTIGSRAIYNNIPDFANAGDVSSGVYLGTDGIRLGTNFTVSTAGNVTANNMKLTGTLTIGTGSNNTISANNLRSGAGGGLNFTNATKSSGGSYPSYFGATTISANNLAATQKFTFRSTQITDWVTLQGGDGYYYKVLGYRSGR